MKTRDDPEILISRSHTHTIEWFTGDGTTTVFHLAKTPQNASQLMVFVDGLLKRPSDRGTTHEYTLSGATVTLAVAPANGKAVACWEVSS